MILSGDIIVLLLLLPLQFFLLQTSLLPLQFGLPVLSPATKFSEQTDQLERCLAFLKTAEPKPLTMNTLNSREGRRTCSTAWQAAKHFFFFSSSSSSSSSPAAGGSLFHPEGCTDAEVQEATRERDREREREPSSRHFFRLSLPYRKPLRDVGAARNVTPALKPFLTVAPVHHHLKFQNLWICLKT